MEVSCLDKDRAIGASILAGSVVGIIVYGWLLYAFATIVLQITAFLAVAVLLGILAWIGWTMATTPPPAPIEDISPPSSVTTTPETASTTTQQKQTDVNKS